MRQLKELQSRLAEKNSAEKPIMASPRVCTAAERDHVG